VSVLSSLTDQPLPTRSPRSVDVAPLVIQDIEARIRRGIETYGQPLRTHNGRDALWDAYEEQIDGALYLRQAIEEIKDLRAEIAALRAELGKRQIPEPAAPPWMQGIDAIGESLTVEDIRHAVSLLPPDLVKCDGPYRYEPECQACPSHGDCWLASAATRREEAR
jgi:hypothetical protein